MTQVAVDGREVPSHVFRVVPDNFPSVTIRLTVSFELRKLLLDIAAATSSTSDDLISKGIVLVGVAKKARDQGLRLGVVDNDGNLLTEIVGL